MKRMHTLPWLAAAALALTLPLAAVAADEAPSAPDSPEATAPAADTDGLAAAKVARNRRSGKLQAPTAAQDAGLAAQMKAFWAQFDGISHRVKKDQKSGFDTLVVAPTQMRAAVAVRRADGTIAWDCAAPDTDLEKFAGELRDKTATKPAAEER